MKKSRSHQIDTEAQRIFRAALPSAWVINDLYEDYAKDYHVEIGEPKGDLTGNALLVQLKEQEATEFNRERTAVRFSLQTKYAKYFLDKVKDLPVFLIVIDVGEKRGWFVHVQPILDHDQSWRAKKKVTVKLPVQNVLSETELFRNAILDAKRKMRLLHPESIREAIKAHQDRVRTMDPRFDLGFFGAKDADGTPRLGLRPKAPVTLHIHNIKNDKSIDAKIEDLFGRGKLVTFEPGEIRITGSKLFETIEHSGGELQHEVKSAATVTFISKDAQGNELAELTETPGEFSGGMKELWFRGGLTNSPLSIVLGPIVPNAVSGASEFKVAIGQWSGQALSRLAFFDRLYEFLKSVATSTMTELVCFIDGNRVFSAESTQYDLGRLSQLNTCLTMIHRARKVCARIGFDPVFTFEAFDRNTIDGVEELYDVFFEGGSHKKTPNISMTATCVRDTFRFDVVKHGVPTQLKLISTCTYELFKQQVGVGRIVQDFSEAAIVLPENERRARRTRRTRRHQNGDELKVKIVGTPSTETTIRVATPEDE
jgi:hypothetical protein